MSHVGLYALSINDSPRGPAIERGLFPVDAWHSGESSVVGNDQTYNPNRARDTPKQIYNDQNSAVRLYFQDTPRSLM